jgi:peptidoglycan/LPS O-acetylase OafA/YrhL
METSVSPGRAAHGRIDDIEVLRGLAILLVLVEHFRINLIPWFWGDHSPLYSRFGFWSGVDLFFAISGFVIARSLLPTLAAAKSARAFFSATLAFWTRRVWRLLPSAWFWLVVILIAAHQFNQSGAWEPLDANIKSVRAAFFNYTNIRTAFIFGRSPSGAAFPYWSLSLEEQFYATLPFVVFLARRRLPIVLLLVAAVQFPLHRVGPGSHTMLNMIKSDALALGVLLSIWSGTASYRKLEPRVIARRPVLRTLLPLGLLLIFAAVGGGDLRGMSCQVGLVAVLAAVIVWLASYDADYVFPPGVFKRLMCWVGSRSYAIYLIHIPVFFGVREAAWRVDPNLLGPSPQHAALLVASAAVLLFGLAELNYRIIEVPLRRYGARLAGRILQRGSPPAGLAPSPVAASAGRAAE